MHKIKWLFFLLFPLLIIAENDSSFVEVIKIYEGSLKNNGKEVSGHEVWNIPYCFDIDSNEVIFLPNNINKSLKIIKNNKIISVIKIDESIFDVLYYDNSIFVETFDKVTQYSLSNYEKLFVYEIHDRKSYALIDFKVKNDTLINFYRKDIDTTFYSKFEYILEKKSLDGKKTDIKKIDFHYDNVGFTPFDALANQLIYLGKNSLYMPFNNSIYDVNINSGKINNIFKIKELEWADGVLYCDGNSGLLVPFDVYFGIKKVNISNGLVEKINLVPILEKYFNGVIGKDFMYGVEYKAYDFKFVNKQIYLMCSTRTKTYVLKIII
jgi:hypothetical protein